MVPPGFELDSWEPREFATYTHSADPEEMTGFIQAFVDCVVVAQVEEMICSLIDL
jgi:hypothetical protein